MVRYQAALRPERSRIIHSYGVVAKCPNLQVSNSACALVQIPLMLSLGHRGLHLQRGLGLSAFIAQALASAANGIALLVQQAADRSDHLHIFALIVAPVASALHLA